MYPSSYDHREPFPFNQNHNHLFHFPQQQHDHHHPTFLDNQNENEILITHFPSQQQQPTPPGKKRSEPNEQKRSGKKDRHSKIYTAQGPRDRRMRLSLQIARKFFDLQDMLGFDKASKTIEWLFSKSKSAIKELADTLPGCSGGKTTLSSTSESEVVSSSAIFNKTVKKSVRKAAAGTPLRESRDKARARARERTLEKMKIKAAAQQQQPPNPNLQQNQIDSDSVGIIEKFLCSSLLDYSLNVVESSQVWENVGIDQHRTTKEPTGNNLLFQNPNSSIFFNGDDSSPSESILMTHYLPDQFSTLY